jgi:hypothetical protein
MRLWMLPLLAVPLACNGSREAAPARPPADAQGAPEPALALPFAHAAPLELERLVIEGDEAEALRRLGAVPAWQAVVERGNHLARRGQHGAVFGRVGGSVAEPSYRWLVDETEGEGALAIRLAFDPGITVAEGQRVVAWGAWHLDADRRWHWRAERMALLAPAAGPPPPNVDRLAIPTAAQAPASAVPVSRLEGDGDILFEILGSPRDPTDGREITDPGDTKAVARLLLPGEQPSYGGQDYRAPDEHWQLARDTVYTVPVRRQRRQPADKLPILQSRGIPRRVAQAAQPSGALRTGARLEPPQQGGEHGP